MTVSTLDAPGIHSDASSSTSGSFPGYGEDAPLDLSGLTPAAFNAVGARLLDGSFDAWAETAAAVKYCAHPIRLSGSSTTIDARSGELVGTFSSANAPLGVLYRPCGNRRADVCPSCSRTYARDTYAMINAGLVGGKTIPVTVADNPLLFVTFTAPSFGHVHGPRPKNGQPVGGRCRPRSARAGQPLTCEHGRPLGCMAVHDPDDSANGAPLCHECHDTDSAVVWQWHAPELWRRTTIALRRALAHNLGVTETRRKPTKKNPTPPPCLADVASVQFAKVAEYQARGLVHFHALIRLDGPDGPGSPAPLDGRTLGRLLEKAAAEVLLEAPPVDDDDVARVLCWGKQLDVRVVRDTNRTDDPDGPLTPGQVAGYLAKYATKDANSIRADRPVEHIAGFASRCRQLSARAREHYGPHVDANGAPANPYQLLGKWAHMLGFRGHFSTKSRRYSVTLGQLRRARAKYRDLVATAEHDEDARKALLDLGELEARLLADDTETTLVIGKWTYQGTGWTNPGDETLALAAAARAREYEQWKAQTKHTNQKGK
ncbi:replication initiator [Nocardioides sp. NPDC023903]|uniref:replication initiator n=1 Tax=Nocardioides sp. NPDC023903 TaxID=3157195 RepID=UPI0033DFBBB2